ncbi:MAG: class I SAM-dependent methyltransferase [Mycobacterium sp.]
MPRTEGDTWDLASSVGATATGVAASRALASKQPDPLITDPFADALVKAVGLEHCNRMADGELESTDDPLMNRERMCEQIAVRTRFFDDFFTDATDAGIRQAVILAAGLDTRAYRLPWPPDAVVFEIDQPQVIQFKSAVLSGLGATAAAHHRTVEIDLRDGWPTLLRDSGFDPAQPTAWIAEGLLIYLPPEAQDRLFDNMTELSAPGSRLATEHMNIQGSSDDWVEKLDARSHRMGSNLNLADLFYMEDRNAAGDYLASKGWTVTIRPTREAFALNGFELPEDELTALAGDSGYLSAILK